MSNQTEGDTLTVLIVDDTLLYRKVLSDILNEISWVQVVGSASNGKIALTRIANLKPSLVIMDINMPEMDGIEALEHIKKDWPDIGVIMVSAHTQKDSSITMKALEMGAFDFIPKPAETSIEKNREVIQKMLLPMIKAFLRRKEIRKILNRTAQSTQTTHQITPPTKLTFSPKNEDTKNEPETLNVIERMKKLASIRRVKSEVIAIGISTGGPNALIHVIPRLPSNINVPVLIVQHMPPVFTNALAQSLNSKSQLKVVEATDGELIYPNVVYIAPGGKQMKIHYDQAKMIRITDDPPENNCKPSVNYLFRSVAEHYGEKTTAVIMTGMGSDGTTGLKLLKQKNATIIAQDEKSCVVYGMPREPIESGIVDVIASLDDIAEAILKTI